MEGPATSPGPISTQVTGSGDSTNKESIDATDIMNPATTSRIPCFLGDSIGGIVDPFKRRRINITTDSVGSMGENTGLEGT